jgi:hypothetical protein
VIDAHGCTAGRSLAPGSPPLHCTAAVAVDLRVNYYLHTSEGTFWVLPDAFCACTDIVAHRVSFLAPVLPSSVS